MSDHRSDFIADFFVPESERDPVKAARDPARPLPRRFYEEATIGDADGGFSILLDGRPVNTPARRRVVVPSRELAEAMAAEWAAQGEKIDPATMPLTKLVNTTIDGVAGQMAEVEAELVRYAESDMICYRAGEPDSLAAAQRAGWDPLLAFARDKLGARMTLAEGVMFADQPRDAIDALAAAIRGHVGEGPDAPFRLAALHVMTALTGSVILALAKSLNEIDLEAAWRAAHIDEDFQMRAWGEDADALARRTARFKEMAAAAFVSDSVASGGPGA
ncbi:ATP12 family chaperone protein [Methylocystis parvus]|uniref:ATPase n=1 Tax=Methylocystis parvus TaxID=134 RepID=A0A6B8MCT2_9HYPH|nr:ATP12 family protein [Methylocystis parvus]QGM99429.1 ATPase [Methylocystis parvus]WBK00180.1 ATPase [Methylocystis parvus OBBP]